MLITYNAPKKNWMSFSPLHLRTESVKSFVHGWAILEKEIAGREALIRIQYIAEDDPIDTGEIGEEIHVHPTHV